MHERSRDGARWPSSQKANGGKAGQSVWEGCFPLATDSVDSCDAEATRCRLLGMYSSGEVGLRHPLERPLFWAYAVLNVLVLAAALFIIFQGSDWLHAHRRLEQYRGKIRALAIAAVVGIPATIFLRNTRHALVRGKSIEISPQQLPEIYALLQRHCDKLGISPLPELYYSDMSMSTPARAHKSFKRDYIVLSSRFFQSDLQSMLPVFSFWIGREIGALRLKHASWPTDLLLSYVDKIPYLSNPLHRVYAYSEDRYGAFLAPEGLAGLVGLASGRRMLPQVNLADYLRQARSYGSVWARLGESTEAEPTVSGRIKALFDAGLLKDETTSTDTTSSETPSPLNKASAAGQGN